MGMLTKQQNVIMGTATNNNTNKESQKSSKHKGARRTNAEWTIKKLYANFLCTIICVRINSIRIFTYRILFQFKEEVKAK